MIPLLERSNGSTLLTHLVQYATAAMMNDSVLKASGVAATLGLLSHWLHFIRGEHHLHALRFFKFFFWFPIVSCLILVLLVHVKMSHALQLIASVMAAYLGALWTSMIIYRAFFHRLHHFPGPRLAKTSKLYHVSQLGKMDNCQKLAGWHQAYGDFVRIGKPANFYLTLDISMI